MHWRGALTASRVPTIFVFFFSFFFVFLFFFLFFVFFSFFLLLFFFRFSDRFWGNQVVTKLANRRLRRGTDRGRGAQLKFFGVYFGGSRGSSTPQTPRTPNYSEFFLMPPRPFLSSLLSFFFVCLWATSSKARGQR